MVIFQTSREGSALFSDVVSVPRAVEFKMATGCKFLSLAASVHRLSLAASKLYGKRFLVDVLSQLESYNVRYNQFDNTTFRLDWFLGVLDRFSSTNLEDKVIIDRLIAQLQQVKAIVVQLDNDIFVGYCPQKIYSQYRRKPSFDIPKEQIELFLEYNFLLPQISEILGVSLSTVNRRLN